MARILLNIRGVAPDPSDNDLDTCIRLLELWNSREGKRRTVTRPQPLGKPDGFLSRSLNYSDDYRKLMVAISEQPLKMLSARDCTTFDKEAVYMALLRYGPIIVGGQFDDVRIAMSGKTENTICYLGHYMIISGIDTEHGGTYHVIDPTTGHTRWLPVLSIAKAAWIADHCIVLDTKAPEP